MRPPPTLLVAAAALVVAVQGYPCGAPGSPLHGYVSPSSRLFYAGENVTVTCQPGYVQFGLPSRTCRPDGTWQGLMPFCKRNVAYKGSTQGPPSPLAPMQDSEPGLAADGDMQTCSRAPRDVRERWWQVRLPSRTRVESVGLAVPPGRSLDLSIFIISLNTPEPESADYQLCANFTGVLRQAKQLFHCGSQGLVGEYVYIRDEKHHVDYFTLCEVEVFAFGDLRDCGEPEQPAHGHVSRPDSATAAYRCQNGYRLAGRRQRRCNRGEWTGQQPVCRKIFCERPPLLENGHLDASVPSLSRYSYNASVQYRCVAGYTMQGGAGARTCGVDGRWSGAMPRCQPLVCHIPPKYLHARHDLLNGTTRWMAMAKYSCEEGFALQPGSGPVVTHCQGSGQWRPVNVSCVPATPAGGALPDHGLTVINEEHQPMSSDVVAGLWVAAAIAIGAMIIIGILFTRKRVWRRRKHSGPPNPVVSPADVKTYDQVYEPSYQNVFESEPPTLQSFRAAGSPRASAGEADRPFGRPVEPPYETLRARLAAGAPPDDHPYEAVAGGRVYDAVAGDATGGQYQSLPTDQEPDYETLRVQCGGGGGAEGDYDLLPGRPEPVCPQYDQVPSGAYENCRFEAGAAPGEVPDLLKGASAVGRQTDIPPEILALYAKVVKSKKRNRDDGEPAPSAPDSACPSSPGSSAASSYTRNLIAKFNRLAGSEAGPTADAAPRTPGDDSVQYTQICATDGGSGARRPSAESVVYSTVRPLPPVPPEA